MSDTDERRPAPPAGSVVATERARRLAKLGRLSERGIPPYPVRFDRDCTAAELKALIARDDVDGAAARAICDRLAIPYLVPPVR